MGKLQQFMIKYDNNTDVYMAGQNVYGRVFVVLNEPMKMRGLRVKLDGRAHTEWRESRTRSHTDSSGHTQTETYYVTYTGNECYIGLVITLWGKPEGASGDDPTMQPGSYEFPFSFTLPLQCPSSFEGQYGHIRYICKAVIDRPWRFDHKCLVPFTVVSLVDLNREPTAMQPIIDTKTKTLGCGCCISGTLECSVNIPRSGFVPGESFPINMEIHNKSRTEVDVVTAQLCEVVIFRAEGETEHSSRTIASLSESDIAAGQSQIWSDKFLLIPPVAPTLKSCSIINAGYELQILINPTGCHSKMRLCFPILIGNIPLRSVYQNAPRIISSQPMPQPTALTFDETKPSAPPAYGDYPDLPPPSYQDAVFGGGNCQEGEDQYTGGPKNYAPRYPFYGYLTNPQNKIH